MGRSRWEAVVAVVVAVVAVGGVEEQEEVVVVVGSLVLWIRGLGLGCFWGRLGALGGGLWRRGGGGRACVEGGWRSMHVSDKTIRKFVFNGTPFKHT